MKNGKILGIVLLAAIFTSTLTGCGWNRGKGEASSSPSSVQSSSSAPASSDSESASSLSSVAGVSSVAQSEPTPSQNGPVLPVQTDDKAFNEKFAANPIDKAYIKESAKAISNVDMVNVSNKYTILWQTEVGHAYSELTKALKTETGEKAKQLKAEQEKWERGKSDALKKIGEETQADGSMATVNEASKIMDLYRSRAAQIYRELYVYNKDYAYAYGR